MLMIIIFTCHNISALRRFIFADTSFSVLSELFQNTSHSRHSRSPLVSSLEQESHSVTNTVQQRKSVLLLYSEQINNEQYTEMCVCVLVALVQIQNISGCGWSQLVKLGWNQPIFRPSLRCTDSREGPTRANLFPSVSVSLIWKSVMPS